MTDLYEKSLFWVACCGWKYRVKQRKYMITKTTVTFVIVVIVILLFFFPDFIFSVHTSSCFFSSQQLFFLVFRSVLWTLFSWFFVLALQRRNVNAHKRIIHMRKSYHSLKVALQTAMGLMGPVVVAMELTGPLVAVEVLVFLFVSLIASSVHVHKTFELAACCCR